MLPLAGPNIGYTKTCLCSLIISKLTCKCITSKELLMWVVSFKVIDVFPNAVLSSFQFWKRRII